jgi:hypothetical protein
MDADSTAKDDDLSTNASVVKHFVGEALTAKVSPGGEGCLGE